MSTPAPKLRQPKSFKPTQKAFVVPKYTEKPLPNIQYVIITLRDKTKLVLPADGYHGIITAGEMFKCVFCDIEINLNEKNKDQHKNSQAHIKNMANYPHIEGFPDNLLRQINKDKMYCTICSVEVCTSFLTRHIDSEVHNEEFDKAVRRSITYKPFSFSD